MGEKKDKLRISRLELQKAADFLPYPLLVSEEIGEHYHNLFLNKKFLEEIGYTVDEIPTKESWFEKAYPDEEYRREVIAEWVGKEIEASQNGEDFVRMTAHVNCKDNIKRWYEIKASAINNFNFVAFVDLDKEIVLQEELKSINRNNDRMLSILGHDLRSPVANLISISSMAANQDLSQSEFSSLIQMINEQSLQVLDLLDNTFNWARLNLNSIKINKTTVDFEKLIATTLGVYKSFYEGKNIFISTELESDQKIETDLEITTVIIRNIMSNAIKFTPENGKITIKSHHNELIIKDTGIGMSAASLSAILDNNSLSRMGTNDEQGTGIGLQLVISLARKINCKFTIESLPSEGTTIRLIFDA
jgi:signal transduction histidine kinase